MRLPWLRSMLPMSRSKSFIRLICFDQPGSGPCTGFFMSQPLMFSIQ